MNKQIIELINAYVKSYRQLNSTKTGWREPEIAFASADDSLFPKLKELVSPSHALPSDFVKDAKSVIVFFLPFEESIVKSNIKGVESSREWDIANIETNNLIIDLSTYIFKQLLQIGYTSTVLPPTYNYDEENLISDWSHRHVGYIAGLGTFGINNMFITESGCCGRMGSIITDLPLLTTERKKQEYCLYKFNGTCKKCVNRCVINAISTGHGFPFVNKKSCNDQIYNNNIPQYETGIGDSCGKCMCDVPCSMVNPVKYLPLSN